MMREIRFRAWSYDKQCMYFRAYQKAFHVLLCEDDHGKNRGQGQPVERAGYGDCCLMECTDVLDASGVEIFEGDIIKISLKGSREVTGIVGTVPDMFRSRGLHPLQSLLDKHQILVDDIEEIKIAGNQFVNEELVKQYNLERVNV